MDLVPAPSGENPVKTPVVEVEAVDLAEQVHAETVALEEASSDYETDSDDSEGWEALSHGQDAVRILRDEQLRDGLGTSLCYRHFRVTPDIPRYRYPHPIRANMTAAIQFPVPAPWKRRSHIGNACTT